MPLLASVLIAQFVATTAATAAILCQTQSCLLARDITNIYLDMTVQQVAALLPNGLKPIGYSQFEGSTRAVRYNFGVTLGGHLYRIYSSRN